MTRTSIPRRRKKPRRVLGREKLYGKAKEARRREIFERSQGKCEAIIYCQLPECQPRWHALRHCGKPITWETFEWSHNHHGPRRDDSLAGGIASCKSCHEAKHNAGGKPCPKKVMIPTMGFYAPKGLA